MAAAFALSMLFMYPAATPAQSYPGRPIRMIVPFPPGGGLDFIGRIVGKHLTDRLGQPIVIDNRAGANGVVGLQALKSSSPDGYTIAVASAGTLVVNPYLYQKLSYDTLRDFAPIGNMVNFPLLLVVHPSLPVRNVRELMALAKKRPREISYSSGGVGNSAHLSAELFGSMTKAQILHVPYKGTGPAVTALLSGEVQFTFSPIPSVLPHVRNGRLKALGIGNLQRIPSLPEFPTIAESGLPGYEAYAWGGMIGPAGMPRDIVQRLNKEIVATLHLKEVADRMLAEGTVPAPSTPEEFTAYIKSELKKWGDVVKMAGIKAE